MQDLTKSTNANLQQQNLKQNIEDHITLLLTIFTELNKEYSDLINSILFAKQNVLHPSILTPTRIISKLTRTRRYLPPSTSYPFPLKTTNTHEFFKILSLSVYYTDLKLIFLINIPITDDTKYTLYHLLPLSQY